MLQQSIELYDRRSIEGFFVFSGSALHAMNASEWAAYDLPGHLHRSYFPWLGSARVSVVTEQHERMDTTAGRSSMDGLRGGGQSSQWPTTAQQL